MHLTHLSLTNFRNYVRLELDLPTGTVLLHGGNAQGKTNLLEAIYYLATTRSPQAVTDRELINWLAEGEPIPFARLVAQVTRGDALNKIEITLVKQGLSGANNARLTKEIRVNGVRRRAIDFIGQVNVVLFTPQDIDLVIGSPSLRRRYLDVTLCQIDHRYCRSLQQYNKVLAQRNHLLRALQEGARGLDQLEFWDHSLSDHGAYLLARRLQVVEELNGLVRDLHYDLTGGDELLQLAYSASVEFEGPPGRAIQLSLSHEAQGARPSSLRLTQDQLAAAFRTDLQQHLREEIARGMTVIGPHRDDLRFMINDTDLSVFGSRGQQRTGVISLKLAETEFMYAETMERPILLLDDVMSELDDDRRRYLTQRIGEHQQVVVTTTHLSDFPPALLSHALLLRVEGGRIEREQASASDASLIL